MRRPTRSDPGGRAYLDLQNRARREGRSTQELLVLYALERFLARLSTSEHSRDFVLKGGMLLAAFGARRATVDADFLATGFTNHDDTVLTRVRAIARADPGDDDGVTFAPDSARAQAIRESDRYAGVRVTLPALVATAKVRVQLDIGFGDPVTPRPELVHYPTLRSEHDPVRILGYPICTVVAEKVVTAIDLGETSTRVRDYADVWSLTRGHDLEGDELFTALATTAAHRGVDLRPLSSAIGDVATIRQDVYAAYRRRVDDSLPVAFADVVAGVTEFADPLLHHGRSTSGGADWRSGQRRWVRRD